MEILIDEAMEAVRQAAQILPDDVGDWVVRSAPRHLRVRVAHEVVPPVDRPDALGRLDPGQLSHVMAKIEGGSPVHRPCRRDVDALCCSVVDLRDWIASLPDGDRHRARIDRMSLEEGLALSAAWHGAVARGAEVLADASVGTRTLATLEDGTVVHELLTARALSHESAVMGHCVRSYARDVEEGRCRILSLRDAAGGSHVTVEVTRGVALHTADAGVLYVREKPPAGSSNVSVVRDRAFVQVRDGANEPPTGRWARRTEEAERTLGWHRDDDAVRRVHVAHCGTAFVSSLRAAAHEAMASAGPGVRFRRAFGFLSQARDVEAAVEIASDLWDEAVGSDRDETRPHRVSLGAAGVEYDVWSHGWPHDTILFLSVVLGRTSGLDEPRRAFARRLKAALDLRWPATWMSGFLDAVESAPDRVHVLILPRCVGDTDAPREFGRGREAPVMAWLASMAGEVERYARLASGAHEGAVRGMRDTRSLLNGALARDAAARGTMDANLLRNVLADLDPRAVGRKVAWGSSRSSVFGIDGTTVRTGHRAA